ncbi:MAG: putative rane protein [Blastococcus sp.]|jgi:putative membrane protein|nr:putative rane protein [Blastococcus sp.]
MMWWPNGGMSGGGWVMMAIGMVLFWGLIITGAVLLVRIMNRPSGGTAPVDRPSPGQLLAERFARGEIDEDEYHRRLATLAAAASRAA